MSGSERGKQKLDINGDSDSKLQKKKGKLAKADLVANVSSKVNKTSTPKTRSGKARYSGQKESHHDSDEEEGQSGNNNAQIDANKIESKDKESVNKDKTKSNHAKQVRHATSRPDGASFMGDGIEVIVDTTEFDESDEEGLEQDKNDTNAIESESSESDSDGKNDGHNGNEILPVEFDETLSSLPENEIFFNFHHSNPVDEGSTLTMADMVEQMVNDKLSQEKAKLKKEFAMLEEMRAEYRQLLNDKKKQDNQEKSGQGKSKTIQSGNGRKSVSDRDRSMVKSPSDMTVYAPALVRTPDKNGNQSQVGEDYIKNIANFVEHMHLQQEISE